VKINDVMEFPLELDLQPWTAADLGDESSLSEGDSEVSESQSVGPYSDHEAISEENPHVVGGSSD
jgi:hypothetical protein